MAAWLATSPSFDYCVRLPFLMNAGASIQEREMFRVIAGIPTRKDGCRTALGRYQVAILYFVVLLILSLPRHNRVKLLGSLASPLWITKSNANDTLLLFWHYMSDKTGGVDSTICSAVSTIPLEITATTQVLIKFVFGYCFGIGAAIICGTVLLALMHVGIALVDFFSEPLKDNSVADKYRQNAPCPHLIVPVLKETRGQFAKTPVLIPLCDN